MPEKLLDLLSDSGENLTNRGSNDVQWLQVAKELACAPGCLLAYFGEALGIGLVLANSVGWVR